ncbi:hypothetical protein OF83DRAFT_1180050 [Amylostereum chailletii]|nr:hypothetical protein OF83DRAFT_1180050 [Amylostereum chailletii]
MTSSDLSSLFRRMCHLKVLLQLDQARNRLNDVATTVPQIVASSTAQPQLCPSRVPVDT